MAQCKKCGAEIYFLKTSRGKFIPVDADTISEQDLNLLRSKQTVFFDYKQHISHFATCPNADEFRRKKTRVTNK